jgi:FkbM family methyltransferase
MIVGFESYRDSYDFSDVRGVIHVGAHHGQEYGDYLETFGQDIKTHWFEPLHEAYVVLEANLLNKPGTVLYNCALGPEETKMKIWEDSGNGGQSSSLMRPKDHLTQWDHITFAQTSEVDVKILDSFAIRDANVLVIDAQGYELEVLKGAKETLDTIDHVFCEINSKEMYEGCPSLFDLDCFLGEHGFVLREDWWTSDNWGDAYWSR